MNRLRRYGFRIISLTTGSALLFSISPQVAQAAAKSPTTSSVLTATKAAVAKESGVHVTHTSKSGTTVTTVVADIGKTSGTEKITSGADVVLITVTPTYVYLSGSAGGLTNLMGLSPAQQKKVGAHSISMKKGTTPYANLALSATISLLSRVLPAVKGTVLSVKGAKNSKYYQLKWTTKATSSTPKETNVMSIADANTALPIKETITASSGAATTTFSKWGEPISVTPPAASSVVTYAQVFG